MEVDGTRDANKIGAELNTLVELDDLFEMFEMVAEDIVETILYSKIPPTPQIANT
tara:strand:- start:278 stop:442 length:165 start_codon:yes stop_codon:yes gene_type:complete